LVQQQQSPGAGIPAVSHHDEEFSAVERLSENFSDKVSTSQPPSQDVIRIPGSESVDAVYSPRLQSTDALGVSVCGPRTDLEIRACVPTDVLYVPVTASREAVSKPNHGLGDDLRIQKLATVHGDETHQDHRNDPGRIAWLLGDDGLESCTSTDFLLPTKHSCTTSDPRLRIESAAVHTGDLAEHCGVRRQTLLDDGALVEQALDELIGAASPLANLPTEKDIDALIDLLRTSPLSSKQISHTSTISINDILDDDPDLEATVDLDPPLCSLVDGYSVDDAEELLSNGMAARSDVQTARKSHAEAMTFRNIDQHGFGFGLDAFGTDQIGEDVAKQLAASDSGTQAEDDTNMVDEIVKSELTEVNDRSEIPSDSIVINSNTPKDSLSCDNEHDSIQHNDISRTVVDPNDRLADDVATQCTLSEMPPRSSAVLERHDHVENSDNVAVVEALSVSPNLAIPNDGDNSHSSDSTCRRVKLVDHDVEEEQSPISLTGQSKVDDHKSEKSEVTSRESVLQKLTDITTDRSRLSKNIANSQVQPIVRRKSCEWIIDADVPKSEVEVGKDNVTALTAYFEEVHADQCPGCTICLTGNVERPFVIHRRSSLPVGTGTGFTSPDEVITDRDRKNLNRLLASTSRDRSTLDSASNDNSGKLTATPEPVSDTGLAQATNSLSAVQTSKLTPENQKKDHTFRNSLSSVTVTEGDEGYTHQTSNVLTSTASRLVVSLPDVFNGDTARSRDGQRRTEFRFRLAKVQSHSLRSFNDLTATGVAKRSITSQPFEPVASQPPFQHPGSSAEREQSIRKVSNVDVLASATKSTDSKVFVSVVSEKPSSGSAAQRLKPASEVVSIGEANKKAGAAAVSLDKLLVELCRPTPTTTEKESDSSMTPDMIRKYRIEPQKRGPPPPPPPRHGSRLVDSRGRKSSQDPRASDDEVMRRKHGGLEQRIDAMLLDADSRWSDDEWQRPVRRNVPRTIAAVPAQPVSDLFDLCRMFLINV